MPKGQKISTAKTPPRKGGIVAPADTGTGSVSLTALGTAATENFDTLGRERSQETFYDANGSYLGALPVDTRSNSVAVTTAVLVWTTA